MNRLRFLWPGLAWAVLWLAMAGSGWSAPPLFTLIPLGTDYGSELKPFGINESGLMAATYHIPGVTTCGCTHDGVVWHPFPEMVGVYSDGFDVNDHGVVAGRYSGEYGFRAYFYDQDGLHELGTLGGRYSWGFGVNNLGDVVGQAMITDGSYHAFWYDGTDMRDLGTLGGSQSFAYDINENQVIVGKSVDALGRTRPFVYQDGQMIDLGEEGDAQAVNDLNMVAGYALNEEGERRAYLYDNGVMTNLGTLGGFESYALDLNNKGQVVGVARTPDNRLNAFFYDGQTMWNLNELIPPDSDFVLGEAFGINEKGQICGKGNYMGVGNMGFRLDPVPLAIPCTCIGFKPPLAGGPVTVKKNRVLPVKAVLVDEAGNSMTPEKIAAPILVVTYTSQEPGQNPVDVSQWALPAGVGSEGNQFEYVGNKWQYNLKVSNYTAPGTYTITMRSGDEEAYVVKSCLAEFIVKER